MTKYVAYDIEVFAHDSLIVFKDLDNRVLFSAWNNFSNVAEFIEDKVLIGYNCYYYDDVILTCMMRGFTPERLKVVNDQLIHKGDTFVKVDPRINSLDCFQQIDVSLPGLKKIEANMGKMIKESATPFDIDRPLTEEERQEVYEYCCYDIESTIAVYKLREGSYFESKAKLLELYDNPRAKRWNTTTISANLLLDKPLEKWACLKVPDELWRGKDIPDEVWSMWEQVKGNYDMESRMKVKSRTINKFNNAIQFGFGGLHGAYKGAGRFENVKLLDVASMYPSIIINLDVLGYATPKYAEMKEERIRVKHTDKPLSDALKLVLNSVYGNLKNQYSTLNNPKASMTVCIYGQIALFTLCQMLHDRGCTVININTDGVAFVDNGKSYCDIWGSWEKQFNLTLEEDHFDLWIQKDVNNYIATQGGKVKTKGGEVGKYSKDKFFSNNNARILDIALVEYLVHGKSTIDTILEHTDKPYLYQYILQSGRTYKGTYDEMGNKYQNVNRIFASKEKYADPKLYKKRHDGGLVHFPDAPDHMKHWDGDCDDIEDFGEWIDINHYYKIVSKRLQSWKVV